MDARLDIIMSEIISTDKSFTDKSFFGFTRGYSQKEVREIWLDGIRNGIEKGLMMASLQGQKVEMNKNLQNENQKEFYKKFLKLTVEHDCHIQYHPLHGMCVLDYSKPIP